MMNYVYDGRRLNIRLSEWEWLLAYGSLVANNKLLKDQSRDKSNKSRTRRGIKIIWLLGLELIQIFFWRKERNGYFALALWFA